MSAGENGRGDMGKAYWCLLGLNWYFFGLTWETTLLNFHERGVIVAKTLRGEKSRE